MDCAVCKGRRYVVERVGDRATARVCGCATPCPTCHGEGFVLATQRSTFSEKVGAKEYDVVSPCACRLLEGRVRRYNQALVPGVLAHADFDGYKPQSPAQDRARTVAMRFAHGYVRGQTTRGFILSGPVGTGKTHLLAAAISHLVLELGVACEYVEISLLYSTIRRGFQEGKSGGEIIGPLSEVEVLAIDELGKGRGSAFEMETLDELIARRYNAGRTTLFASNYPLDYERKAKRPGKDEYVNTATRAKEAAREAELLRERVGERIYSRLCEMCEFVQLPADTRDMRRVKQELDHRTHR